MLGDRISALIDASSPPTSTSIKAFLQIGCGTEERIFRFLIENIDDVVSIEDLGGCRLYVSPAAQTIFGYRPDELVGTYATDFVHPDDAHHVLANRGAASDGRTLYSVRHRHKAVDFVWVEISVRAIKDPATRQDIGSVVVMRDISHHRRIEDQLRGMACHDALTGLPNRILFREHLDQAIARHSRTQRHFAVLACDLDRFKDINDSLGHAAGDALLRTIAERMRNALQSCDTVARLGGDEFAIVLADLHKRGSAETVAEHLMAVVREPIDLSGRIVEVSLSVGVAVVADEYLDGDEILKRADIALYDAKASGRKTHRAFRPELGIRLATRCQLGVDLKVAAQRGEIRLVYQPIVDTATGTVVCFEALMRWHHPVRGEISMREIASVAEETGLIVSLGKWTLREACHEAVRWPVHIRVAVNVFSAQLRHGGLEAAVLTALASSGLHPSRLKLEVSESGMLLDADGVLACLHRLRALGVRVALDDFGIGHSSLIYIRRFPFNKIKIDRSLIHDIVDPNAAAIVRAVIGIGERLDMGIVAEGVETVEQLERVRLEGCRQVQGFLLSRPLSAEQARAYVKSSSR